MSLKHTLEIINQMQAEEHYWQICLGGAVGATFHLEPSATEDIDIFVLLPTTPGSSLLSLAPSYEYLKARGCKDEGERILIGDWLVPFLPAHGSLEHEALDEAIATQVEGVSTYVPTAEHLVALALRAGRAKDYARILRFRVDADKLNRVLMQHGLVPKWEKFERKYLEE